LTEPRCGLVAPARRPDVVNEIDQDGPIEPDPIEVALARTVSAGAAAIAARLTAVEGGRADLVGLDWCTLFYELRALRPHPEIEEWWDTVISSTVVAAIAPLERRLLAIEASHRAPALQ
jgi:hypothetical protein